MGVLKCIFLLALICFVYQADARKTYADMFPHKHIQKGKLPFPIPPVPGWSPDSNPWDDYLYPPFKPKPKELTHRRGKPTVRLTSDSPALNGSNISFTAKLEYPPCQKEDDQGQLVWDEHCDDGTELEASANGQVRSGFVYNWTSWMDDYGFGKCKDANKCNVFPDGKPFPQSNDWRRKNYVYVWHMMGQYFETCDGSSSSLTLNTSNIPLGGEVMEVMVYRKRERRKYTPLSTDNTIFYITDMIPLVVDISQKAAVNESDNVFYRGEDVVFHVHLHDPSGYLKTAANIDYMWDFRDGNQLVTHRDVTTHAYGTVGNMTVKLVVEAAFPTECPPAAATSMPTTSMSTATSATPSTATTETTPGTTEMSSSTFFTSTTGFSTTEALTSSQTSEPAPFALLRNKRVLEAGGCFRYVHGIFVGNISIIEPKHPLKSKANSRIVDVLAARVTKTDISFLVKCLGSNPTSACTIVSDPSCTWVHSIMCNDVPPSTKCEVQLRRTFPQPGTYCVNITLEDSHSLTLTSTTVTINKSQATSESKNSHTTEVVLTTSVVLVAFFALIACVVYRRYKVYRPIRRSPPDNGDGRAGVAGGMIRLREALFPTNEESHYLLTERNPL
ncbi:protein QNR-71 isoform X2 [Corythoichthys intestinalis]|uniref:protein QNR-71 isoform X2 n=1 Tax=Corythoichthys intestinalis TaxID=161448 RepID=UPI0025A547FB|nr:protein QNR-71 isoform X2 [Corythoichthys intestinalis]